MSFKNQQQFIAALDRAGELVRITEYVDPKLEIAEITDRISKTPAGEKPCCSPIRASLFPY